MKPSKCQWIKTELTFLGHKVSAEGIKPDDYNLKKIREAAPPQDIREIRRFLGMCQYYRQFIPKFADIAQPLYC